MLRSEISCGFQVLSAWLFFRSPAYRVVACTFAPLLDCAMKNSGSPLLWPAVVRISAIVRRTTKVAVVLVVDALLALFADRNPVALAYLKLSNPVVKSAVADDVAKKVTLAADVGAFTSDAGPVGASGAARIVVVTGPCTLEALLVAELSLIFSHVTVPLHPFMLGVLQFPQSGLIMVSPLDGLPCLAM